MWQCRPAWQTWRDRVIPSFGGYSADHGGTEIADSCTNAQSIAADYEQVITTLGVTRLDVDVESSSPNNTAGITRRNQAIRLTEHAAANGASVTSVNIMVFDYYIAKEGVVRWTRRRKTRPLTPTPSWNPSSRA